MTASAIRQAIEAMETAKTAEDRLAAMRELGVLVGGAPDPEEDLAGWLEATQAAGIIFAEAA